MYVIAADDEPLILNSMTRLLHAVFPDAQVRGFGTAQEVESFAREAVASCANIAYAFLDCGWRRRSKISVRIRKSCFQRLMPIIPSDCGAMATPDSS